MERTQIYLTKNEKKEIKKEANEIGISKSELIRRIIDLYIDEKNKNE